LKNVDGKVGIDIGCGSERWAKHIAYLVKKLHCVDAGLTNIEFSNEVPFWTVLGYKK